MQIHRMNEGVRTATLSIEQAVREIATDLDGLQELVARLIDVLNRRVKNFDAEEVNETLFWTFDVEDDR